MSNLDALIQDLVIANRILAREEVVDAYVSTPERKCISGPEKNCITEGCQMPPRDGLLRCEVMGEQKLGRVAHDEAPVRRSR
jgi:hypothetical protein